MIDCDRYKDMYGISFLLVVVDYSMRIRSNVIYTIIFLFISKE